MSKLDEEWEKRREWQQYEGVLIFAGSILFALLLGILFGVV